MIGSLFFRYSSHVLFLTPAEFQRGSSLDGWMALLPRKKGTPVGVPRVRISCDWIHWP
jgi:hypothetical protein